MLSAAEEFFAGAGEEWRRGMESNHLAKALQTFPSSLGFRAIKEVNELALACLMTSSFSLS